MFNEIAAELLRRGSYVRFRAIGASMQPTIEDGELITLNCRDFNRIPGLTVEVLGD